MDGRTIQRYAPIYAWRLLNDSFLPASAASCSSGHSILCGFELLLCASVLGRFAELQLFLAMDFSVSQPREDVLLLQPKLSWPPPVNALISGSSKCFFPKVHWVIPACTSMRTGGNQCKCEWSLVELKAWPPSVISRVVVMQYPVYTMINLSVSFIHDLCMHLGSDTISNMEVFLEYLYHKCSVYQTSVGLKFCVASACGQAAFQGGRRVTAPSAFADQVRADNDCYLDGFLDQGYYHEDYYRSPIKLEEVQAPWDPGESALRYPSKLRLGGKPSFKEGGMLGTSPTSTHTWAGPLG